MEGWVEIKAKEKSIIGYRRGYVETCGVDNIVWDGGKK